MNKWSVERGDCLEVLRTLEPESIDACVTDPPYDLAFMGKAWDKSGVAFQADTWRAVYRVLKPGGHLLAFGGTRTYHRLTCAIEDAGFEIRDCLAWLYGSGFPKSKNLDGDHDGWGTALKPAFEPVVLARKPLVGTVAANVQAHGTGALNVDGCRIETDESPSAKRRMAGYTPNTERARDSEARGVLRDRSDPIRKALPKPSDALGRWPANVILDAEAGAMLDEQSGATGGSGRASGPTLAHLGDHGIYGKADGERAEIPFYGDTGGASRFFYCPKPDRVERNVGLDGFPMKPPTFGADKGDGLGRGISNTRQDWTRANTHPTVKPVALMQWLVRLVTPKGGTVLDPFTGSGTTGMAALREGFAFIGIEREAEYVEIARARIIGDAPLLNTQEAL